MLLPIALLALVGGLCFVGCSFDTHGIPPDFTTYSSDDIVPNPDCVAYWKLDDEGPMAIDSKGGHDGTYFKMGDLPGQFPCPTFMNGGFRSAACTGSLKEAQANSGIVIGDFEGGSGGSQAPCIETDGAYVEIAANNVTTPPNQFSVEAWVRPGWDPSDSDAVHTFLDFRFFDGTGFSGFSLAVNGQGLLQGAVGLGAAGELIVAGGPVPLQQTSHVVMTFDGTTAALFLNGMFSSQQSIQSGTYVPNTMGRQTLGAGAPWAPNRSDQTPSLFFPAFPYKGKIQDVAIYSKPLDAGTIQLHNTHGLGNKDT